MDNGLNLDTLESLVDSLGSEAAKPRAVQPLDIDNLFKTDLRSVSDPFMRYRVKAARALHIYRKAKEDAYVSDTGLSASIDDLANPFLKGHFTLAVVGKMSAGKSTFINALLGDNSLLPTGYFQTTCTLTSISHSAERCLHVVYGDDREESAQGDIGELLARLVAIDPKYKDLPVNNINRLVLAGKSPAEICSPEMIAEMEELSKTEIDLALLKEYLDSHSAADIPVAVSIECPLKEQYRGWRIVDTPGVDAVGGIEDDTKAFLCGTDDHGFNNVDAIIFIQAAKGNIEERTLNEFVANTIDSISEEARKRTFFVLTHGSDRDFLRVKEQVMERARKFFVQSGNIGIADERLLAVDSLLALMLNDDSLDFKTLIKKSAGTPAGWNPEEWEVCRILIQQMRTMLEDDDEEEFNNENVRRKMAEIAGFEALRSMLDAFVQTEKQKAFEALIAKIKEDLDNFIAIKTDDIRILTANLGRSPEQFAIDLDAEKAKLDALQQRANNLVGTIAEEYSKSRVTGIFTDGLADKLSYESFLGLPSLNKMRVKAEAFGTQAESIKNSIIERIKEQVNEFLKLEKDALNVQLDAIDVDRIEIDARTESTSTHKEKIRTERKGIKGKIGRIFGRVLDNDWGYEVSYREYSVLDPKKQHELQAKKIFNALKDNLDKYVNKVIAELDALTIKLDKSIKSTIRKRGKDFEDFKGLESLADEIRSKEAQIATINNARKDIDAIE